MHRATVLLCCLAVVLCGVTNVVQAQSKVEPRSVTFRQNHRAVMAGVVSVFSCIATLVLICLLVRAAYRCTKGDRNANDLTVRCAPMCTVVFLTGLVTFLAIFFGKMYLDYVKMHLWDHRHVVVGNYTVTNGTCCDVIPAGCVSAGALRVPCSDLVDRQLSGNCDNGYFCCSHGSKGFCTNSRDHALAKVECGGCQTFHLFVTFEESNEQKYNELDVRCPQGAAGAICVEQARVKYAPNNSVLSVYWNPEDPSGDFSFDPRYSSADFNGIIAAIVLMSVGVFPVFFALGLMVYRRCTNKIDTMRLAINNVRRAKPPRTIIIIREDPPPPPSPKRSNNNSSSSAAAEVFAVFEV